MGTAIRIAIVVAWLALIGQQIVRHVLPGWGLVERRDVAAAIATQLDRSLRYDLRQRGSPAGGDGRAVGTCQISFQRDEGYFRLDSRIELDLLPVAGDAASTLAPGMGGVLAAMRPTLRVQASQRLDDRLRLVGIEAEGDLGGLHGSLSGTVDHRGLTGTWRMRGNGGSFALAEVGRDGNQGIDLALTLPPNLRPGERFKSTMIDLDPGSFQPRSRTAVFTVEARETIATRGGEMPLVRVAMEADGKRRALYWCDGRGTVFRAEFDGYALVLELTAIDRLPTGQIWPSGDAGGGP